MTFSDCSDDTVPVFWVGPVGDLQALRMPDQGYGRSPDSNITVHQLLDGRAVDVSFREARVWEVALSYLTYAQRLILEEIRTGARGLGPYVFIDPHTPNQFTPNIASGTNVLLTTEGFSVTGTGETLTSTTTVAQRGTRSLAWTLSPAVTGSGGGVLCMSTSYTASGWATPDAQAWAMTGYVRGGGTDPVVTVTPRLSWLDVNGAVVGTTSGSSVATAAGSWTAWSVGGTAPAGAAYVLPQLVLTPGSVGADTVVYVDTLMLDMRATARDWHVGEGQPRVSVESTGEYVPKIGLPSQTYRLYELTT